MALAKNLKDEHGVEGVVMGAVWSDGGCIRVSRMFNAQYVTLSSLRASLPSFHKDQSFTSDEGCRGPHLEGGNVPAELRRMPMYRIEVWLASVKTL